MDYVALLTNSIVAFFLFLLGGGMLLNAIWSLEEAMDDFIFGKIDEAWILLLFIPVNLSVFGILFWRTLRFISRI